MNQMLPAAAVEEYRRQREALLVAYPELAEDDETLRDTLDGITNASDIIAAFIRQAREDEALGGSLGNMLRDMGERKARLMGRAARRREAAQRIMDACGIRKLEQPDFTASIRATPARVEIDDESALPSWATQAILVPNKTLIKKALESGEVSGAHLSNGGETLSIRVK